MSHANPDPAAAQAERLAAHRTLVSALARREVWPAPLPAAVHFEHIETHISTLLLAGDGVLKLKKPLALDFLDFSTPALREQFCREELRINRRTAPALYRAVLPVTGTALAPRLGGDGPAIDWALWMARFDNAQLYDRLARRGELIARHIDALAAVIADFHASLPASPAALDASAAASRWAAADLQALREPAMFDRLEAPAQAQFDALAAGGEARAALLAAHAGARRAAGALVEGHGDLHLGNIVHHEGRPLLFDAVEFNPELRHGDRLNDLAFAFMDLLDHGLPRLAWRLLSQTLEHSGDYPGLPLLRPFAAGRALVRAKVALLQSADAGAAAVAARRIALAHALSHPPPPRLIVTSGLSGSGKSTVALLLAEGLGGIRIRADVERKRLQGLAPTARVDDPTRLYNPHSTQRTYARLAEAAAAALDGRLTAVVDAAFLRRAERDAMRELARRRGVPCTVVECQASEATLIARLRQRQVQATDPSDADARVLALQLGFREPLQSDEPAVVLDTEGSPAHLARRVEALARRLGGGSDRRVPAAADAPS